MAADVFPGARLGLPQTSDSSDPPRHGAAHTSMHPSSARRPVTTLCPYTPQLSLRKVEVREGDRERGKSEVGEVQVRGEEEERGLRVKKEE